MRREQRERQCALGEEQRTVAIAEIDDRLRDRAPQRHLRELTGEPIDPQQRVAHATRAIDPAPEGDSVRLPPPQPRMRERRQISSGAPQSRCCVIELRLEARRVIREPIELDRDLLERISAPEQRRAGRDTRYTFAQAQRLDEPGRGRDHRDLEGLLETLGGNGRDLRALGVVERAPSANRRQRDGRYRRDDDSLHPQPPAAQHVVGALGECLCECNLSITRQRVLLDRGDQPARGRIVDQPDRRGEQLVGQGARDDQRDRDLAVAGLGDQQPAEDLCEPDSIDPRCEHHRRREQL